MRCPVCLKQNKRSIVSVGAGTATAMYNPPFYDEDGVYHDHDPNDMVVETRCSNGHKLELTIKNQCPAEGCDYGKEPPSVVEK